MLIIPRKPDKYMKQNVKSRGSAYILGSGLDYNRSGYDLLDLSKKYLGIFTYLIKKKYKKKKMPYRVKVVYQEAKCFFLVKKDSVDLYKIVRLERPVGVRWLEEQNVKMKILAENKDDGEQKPRNKKKKVTKKKMEI
jgi:hypothetical protein